MAEAVLAQGAGGYLEDLEEMVAPQWRSAFLRFVETGEAEEDFLDFLDRDEQCQRAVEQAFDRQAKGFEGMAAELRRVSDAAERQEPTPSPAQAVAVSAISNSIAAVVAMALQSPPAQRDEVVEKYTIAFAASVSPGEAREVKAVISSVDEELDKFARVSAS
jgi:hypothetical protein